MYSGSLLRSDFRNDLDCEVGGELRGDLRGEIRRELPSKLRSERTWPKHSSAFSVCSASEASNVSDASASFHAFPREFSPPSRFRVTPPEELVLPKPRAQASTVSNLSTDDSCSSSDDGSLPPNSFSGPSWVCPLSSSNSTSSEPMCALESKKPSNEPTKFAFGSRSSNLASARTRSDCEDSCFGTPAPEKRNPPGDYAHGIGRNKGISTVAVAGRQPSSFVTAGVDHDDPPRNLAWRVRGISPDGERNCLMGDGTEPMKSDFAIPSSDMVRSRARSDFGGTGYATHAPAVRNPDFVFAHGLRMNMPTSSDVMAGRHPPRFESFGLDQEAPPRNSTCIGFGTTTDCDRDCHIPNGAGPAQPLSWGDRSATREFQHIRRSRSLHRPVAKHVPHLSGRFCQSRKNQCSLPSVAARAGAMAFGTGKSRDRTASSLTQKDKPRVLPGFARLNKKEGSNKAVSRVFRKIRRAGAGIQ